MSIQVGSIYNVHHSRKGDFVAKLISDTGEFVTLELIEGEPKYLAVGNHTDKGEELIVRKSFCSFEKVGD